MTMQTAVSFGLVAGWVVWLWLVLAPLALGTVEWIFNIGNTRKRRP